MKATTIFVNSSAKVKNDSLVISFSKAESKLFKELKEYNDVIKIVLPNGGFAYWTQNEEYDEKVRKILSVGT